ncbi:MAG: PAS domain S-box protein [Bacteriovoracia bacterium]
MNSKIAGIDLATIYQKIVETSEQGLCLLSPEGRIEFVNDAQCRLIGYSREDSIGKECTNFFAPESIDAFLSRREKRIAGQLREQYEIVFIHGITGKKVYTATTVSPIFDATGKMALTLGIFTDITELKQAQINLNQSVGQLKKAQKIAKLGFWEMNFGNDALWWSDELYEIFEIALTATPPDLSVVFEKIHADDQAELRKLIDQSREQGIPYSMQYRVRKNDGSYIFVRSVVEVQRDEAGKPVGLSGILLDITQQAQSDQIIQEQRAQMVAAAKLSSLGEMAGGVAHEINNPLAVIQMKIELLSEMNAEGTINSGDLGNSLSVLLSTVERISKIVKGLRAFSRDGSNDEARDVEVAQLIDDTVSLCGERFATHGVALHVEPVPEGIFFSGRAVEISQTLLNLLNNSYDAVAKLREKWIKVSVISSADFLEIQVTDSGNGISPEVQRKLFQPFFTTKEIGQGTGLGLSISTGIIKNHGGELCLDPTCPNTRFVIRLPRTNSGAVKRIA